MKGLGFFVVMWVLLSGPLAQPAIAGPPYTADDPEPIDKGHYEVYFYETGEKANKLYASTAGIDFNYGAAPDLQLTAVIPVAFEPVDGQNRAGLGNTELAGKFRFLHQQASGVDAAVFPRIILPSASKRVGDRHPSVLVPLWFEKDLGRWSTKKPAIRRAKTNFS
jgi:hypothetical protein